MRFLKLALVLIFGGLTLNCSDKITSPQYFNQFPLRVGVFWEYESENYKMDRQIISYERMPNDKMGYKMKASLMEKNFKSAGSKQSIKYTFLRLESNQLREYYHSECPNVYAVLLEFPLHVGQGWSKYQGECFEEVVCETTETGEIFCYGKKFFTLQAWDTVVAQANVSTPYSDFADCFEIREARIPNLYKSTWFKPQVGFVKYEEYGDVNSEDFVLTNFGVKRPRTPPWPGG